MSKYLELVGGSFTQEHLDRQKNQNPYVVYSIQEGKVIYTIVPKEEKDVWIITAIRLKDISNCTYNMVDLGLPSGLKWADRNIGSTSPEHYGSYFQWGEIVRDEEGKPTLNAYTYDESAEITTEQLVDILNPLFGPGITVDNVKDVLASQGIMGNDLRDAMKAFGLNTVLINKEFNLSSYFDTTDGGSAFNKYNNNGGLTVLEAIDDAATVYMGSQYRMPTYDEIIELENYTTQTFIDLDGNEYSKKEAQNGVIESGKLKGARFTGPNGNSIFIPAAGVCYNSALQYLDSEGLCWSSSLVIKDNPGGGSADRLNIDYKSTGSGWVRFYGLSVRGVHA